MSTGSSFAENFTPWLGPNGKILGITPPELTKYLKEGHDPDEYMIVDLRSSEGKHHPVSVDLVQIDAELTRKRISKTAKSTTKLLEPEISH